MKKRTKDSILLKGRSMIEILGVLAIVAVLTIGAVLGFKNAHAIDKANKLIQDVSVIHFIFSDDNFKNLSDQETFFSGDYNPVSGYILATKKEQEKFFSIIAYNIPQDVCLEVKKKQLEKLLEIRANDENKCVTQNQIKFLFDTDIVVPPPPVTEGCGSDKNCLECQTDSDCGDCGKCENKRCVYEIGPILNTKNGTCTSCPTTGNVGNTTKEYCEKCFNSYWVTAQSYCSNCTKNTGDNYALKEECLKCPNRYWVGKDGKKGKCGYCPDGGTLNEAKDACNYCQKGSLLNPISGVCENCTVSSSIAASQTECGKCTPNTRFYSTGNLQCLSCNQQSNNSYTPKEECLKCANRYWVGKNEASGNCAYCPGTVNEAKDTCNYCKNVGEFLNISDATCQSCMITSTVSSSQEECNKCPNDTRFWRTDKRCYPCSVEQTIQSIPPEECKRCSNRYYTKGSCAPCPQGQKANEDGTGCIDA